MKKILIFATLFLAITNLNALTAEEVLGNKDLAKQITNTLQNASQENNKNSYGVKGLLYVGPAVLENNQKQITNKNFTLEQYEGYITFSINTHKSFDAFSLEIIPGESNTNEDPHRTNTYSVEVKLFKNNVFVKKINGGVIELVNAGVADEGVFYENLSINSFYKDGKFYVTQKETTTCGKQVDLRKGPKTRTEVVTVTVHVPEGDNPCYDQYHCEGEYVTVTSNSLIPRKYKDFTIYTDQCKTDDSCACPYYTDYID